MKIKYILMKQTNKETEVEKKWKIYIKNNGTDLYNKESKYLKNEILRYLSS